MVRIVERRGGFIYRADKSAPKGDKKMKKSNSLYCVHNTLDNTQELRI